MRKRSFQSVANMVSAMMPFAPPMAPRMARKPTSAGVVAVGVVSRDFLDVRRVQDAAHFVAGARAVDAAGIQL